MGRAVGAPLVVLAIVTFGPALSPFGSVWLVPDRALSIGWLAAVIAALTWLLTSAVRAALQPARDRRAFEHLQDLRVRSGLPDHALLCVLGVQWAVTAGARVTAVDVRDGGVHDLWLSERVIEQAAYALIQWRHGDAVLRDRATATEVLAAQRHEARNPQRLSGTREGRQDRRAAVAVIRAAEALTRRA